MLEHVMQTRAKNRLEKRDGRKIARNKGKNGVEQTMDWQIRKDVATKFLVQ
jgi:hypothetical protein